VARKATPIWSLVWGVMSNGLAHSRNPQRKGEVADGSLLLPCPRRFRSRTRGVPTIAGDRHAAP